MSDIEIVRRVLARELDTINVYNEWAREAQDPRVKDLIMHIARDEEEHVAECIQWLTRLNPVMARYLERDPEHVTPAGAPSERTGTAPLPSSKASRAQPEDTVPPRSARTPGTGDAPSAPLAEPGQHSPSVPAPGGGILITASSLTVGRMNRN